MDGWTVAQVRDAWSTRPNDRAWSPIRPRRRTRRPRTTRTLLLGQVGLLGAIVLAATPVEVDVPSNDEQPENGPGRVDAIAPPADPAPLEQDVTVFDRDEWEVDVEEWERLADCESGDWSAEGVPKEDSARWDYGLTFDHGDHFQGGLNFHPDTWEFYRDPDMPDHAGRATPWQEIEVAERVLEDQGWNAWPVCSRMLDLSDE